jgi:hypothetical protein
MDTGTCTVFWQVGWTSLTHNPTQLNLFKKFVCTYFFSHHKTKKQKEVNKILEGPWPNNNTICRRSIVEKTISMQAWQ